VRCWVNHKKRSVSFDPLQTASGHGGIRELRLAGGEDRMDMEYRYWSFIETHPSHTTLPFEVRTEAMDVLTWAWTDRLLSHRPVPTPFTQEECQELLTLLRSFGDAQSNSGIQSLVHTRIVSRILLRAVEWRQFHFRPNKPLPKDVERSGLRRPQRSIPFRRVAFDFMVSCVCLGIPYLFLDRATRQQRMDEEGGLRNAGPVLMLGACTCLVAAIVLSASVTFLSLPGLDSVARIAVLVAILFASFSMASTLVALFRFKADMDRPVAAAGEGLMTLSGRSIIMSLPLVCLAYAIISFVTGIILYTFRGYAVTDPSLIQRHFENYTRWAVVGSLGGLAGMLTTSLLLLK